MSKKEYTKLLKSAMEKLPEKKEEKKRFQIPEVDAFTQGNKTIIKNFSDILSILRRDKRHLSKYFFAELAAPGNVEGDRLIIQRKVKTKLIEKKLEDYVKEFVFCNECGEPDTILVTKDKKTVMKCEACGNKSSIRTL